MMEINYIKESVSGFLCWTQPMGASRSATAHWALSKLLYLIGLYF